MVDSQCMCKVARMYTKLGQYDRALEMQQEALAVIRGAPSAHDAEHQGELVSILYDLGGTLNSLERYEESKEVWEEVVEKASKASRTEPLAYGRHELAMLLAHQYGRREEAILLLEKAVEYLRQRQVTSLLGFTLLQ